MQKIFLTAAIVFAAMVARAQFTYDYLKAADHYYKKADYNSAAEYYEKYLASRKTIVRPAAYNPYTAQTLSKKPVTVVSSEQQAIYYLAESYRLLNNYKKAAPYYEEALEFDKTQFPLAAFHYATALRALEKYEAAEKAFSYFLDIHSTQDEWRSAAEREVKNLRFIVEQLNRKDLHLYSLQKGVSGLNATGASYAPVWLNDHTLAFTSTRPDSGGSKNYVHLNRIYQAEVNGDNTGSISRIRIPQPKEEHQGVISVTPDGNTLFLTRWKMSDGKKTSAIYSSRKIGEAWSEPAALDEQVNASGFNAQQPFVMPDGRYLLYASDRKGGYGGFDLWYAELDAQGRPMNSRNLGNTVNTTYNEQAPFFHAASGVLVFSSDGGVGMGGYDFFYSKGGFDNWEAPVNFGYPVNSVKDDIYFTSRGTANNILQDAWLASDRSADCCLELFSLNKHVPVPPPPPPPVPEVVKEVPPVETPKVLENVYYDFNVATLKPESYPALDELADMLIRHPEIKIELSAHTDSKGPDKFNQRLSEARARSVVEYLVSKGIDPARLQSKGYGASQPIAPNQHEDGTDNPEGRQQNRRTEFKVLKD
ncbi:OmpA family protein [uncultured Chitinophaga sp.]|jgi:Outer membrane protein and related peptidoglycan-associated (lipo)proteins|uniref:OmpA family protein n=1 Tax=uncultured Chitinophaga sp. TaxID=339340 RepID=UPI0026346CCE|nr:OmpA family protein [uncultured Chitinophaga sp.]